jgi:hypothetical protein
MPGPSSQLVTSSATESNAALPGNHDASKSTSDNSSTTVPSTSIFYAAGALGTMRLASTPSPSSVSSSQTLAERLVDGAENTRISQLLSAYHDLSDHIVRERSKGWEHAGLGGMLVTEWNPEHSRYGFPFSLLWAHDDKALSARNDDTSLAKYLQDMPLLPYWTFSVDGDGDCLMRALILSDLSAPLIHKTLIWDAMLALERDATLGLAKNKQGERDVIHKYRQAYVIQLAQACFSALPLD